MDIDYSACIKHLYPDANDTDYRLRDDGAGIYIEYWNTSKLGTIPLLETLASSWSAASWVLLIREVTDQVQIMLDSAAQSRRYDNMFTMLSYLNSTNPYFKAEAEVGLLWRDALWNKCLQLQADIANGTIVITSVEQFLAELPPIDWGSIENIR